MNQYINSLKQLGLTEKESAVYIALLQLGKASVSGIAEKANIKRPTTYFVIADLVKRGLVSAAGGNIKHYIAEKPEKILNAEKRKLVLFEKALPGLNEIIKTSKQKPSIRFFSGEDGVRAVYEESLLQPAHSEILTLGNARAVEENLVGFSDWYIQRRVKAKIKMRALVTDSPYHRKIVARDQYELRETLLIREELFTQDVEINMYNNIVAMVSFVDQEFVGILLQSKIFTDGYKQMFELLWNLAKKQNKQTYSVC